MTKGNKWFVTRKPSSEFQLYDFARSARQAKDMLESIADGSPIAHRSKSEGGLYNIYVKKGSVYALEKGGMIEVGDKVRAVRDGVGAFSIGKGQTGIVEEITSGGRGVIIELTNGSRRETLIEDIEKHNFRMYAEGGEIARKMLLQNKGVKEVIRKETVNEIRGAIEKEGYNTKGVTDDEILMIHKELQSSFYAEGGEIKGYSGGYDVTIFYTDGTQTVLEGGLPYPEALRIAKKQKIENDVEEVAVIVTDQSSMPHGEQTIRWISGSTYAEGGEVGYSIRGKVLRKGTNDVVDEHLNTYIEASPKTVISKIKERAEKILRKDYPQYDDNAYSWRLELVNTKYAEGGEISEEQIDEINELIAEFMRPINVDTEVWGFLKMARYDAETVNEKLEYISDARFKINVTDPMWQNLVGLQREIEEISSGSSYAEGGEIYSGGVNILKNLIDRDLIKDKNGDHYYEAEDAITDNDEKASFYALKNLWDNSLIKDESGDHFEEVTEYVGKARRHSASTYAEGGNIKGSYFEGELSFLNW